MFLIAGLGNPGNKYVFTRHNIGFLTIDYLCQEQNIELNKSKFKAILGEGKINGEKVILVKPQTYMNLSGESIKEICAWYKIEHQNVIIIYDDTTLDVGKIRIRKKGSDGGHNGIKSIILNLNTDEFPRIRVGIGKSKEGMDLADFVLSKIDNEEKERLFEAIKNASDSVLQIVKGKIDAAMNAYN